MEVQDERNDLTDATVSNSGNTERKGVLSPIELFSPEQVKEHIDSLRRCVGQSKAKAADNENSCQLCKVDVLTFEPLPIYCSPCGARMKWNTPYYTVFLSNTRYYFCIRCYNESHGETIEVKGQLLSKTKLEERMNNEETGEWWVQCDKCERWQHQICALYNDRCNYGGQQEYTCPICYVQEVKSGLRKPLPQNSLPGAKDLPRTVLSDHIEYRLFKRLTQEIQSGASIAGQSFEKVSRSEDLVVRVVSSADKKLEVKPRFLETFQKDNYPAEFPYKSKAILLFQKIEGVEVCQFGMYVQEFGADCSLPNQRHVYLSCLDYVKYFRPETKTLSGEDLSLFVYDEILIGYLEYCKLRGFTSCCIQARPLWKGEYNMLYCSPEFQNTSNPEKLREWYLSMLQKATEEEIVVGLTNLYDHFFITTGECKVNVTATCLPYSDDDYWPIAEDIIFQLRQGDVQNMKGKTNNTTTKRDFEAAQSIDPSENTSVNAMLMQKLGEAIYPMKEDFIVVHLQYSCSQCCILMVSGKRWVCHQCRNFCICDKCYYVEKQLEERERHPSGSRHAHTLQQVDIVGVSEDTVDRDGIIQNEFFDSRQAFLDLCRGNHYQFDTLRRAKHSSMMVLYHLHNPPTPELVTTCSFCCHKIETGHGWQCQVCPDFDVCKDCYLNGAVDHAHKLNSPRDTIDRDIQNMEARQLRIHQIRQMLDLVVHATACRSGSCQIPDCQKYKELFQHGTQCERRTSGGCDLCKEMWQILEFHGRVCKDSGCNIPGCRDLKEDVRRLREESESRRRSAVIEMIRLKSGGSCCK